MKVEMYKTVPDSNLKIGMHVRCIKRSFDGQIPEQTICKVVDITTNPWLGGSKFLDIIPINAPHHIGNRCVSVVHVNDVRIIQYGTGK